ncbi:YrzI family small protein [Pseudalkalibacillus caeni]|uniref:YrzI family small protein n=1 Tax=Exobacillus caeni TaxID=2574798 RepID=A0A5R9FIA8_9BACL|nr:YrzI family small protein [Pseudalkalibacillus caeni]TLS39315.1 YrzI family small protein [Pseudalkalibacillus caeni]
MTLNLLFFTVNVTVKRNETTLEDEKNNLRVKKLMENRELKLYNEHLL